MPLINQFRYDTWVKTAQGPAIPGAQIWVCLQPTNVASLPPTPLANIFSDVNGLVPIQQPAISDGFGHVDFYAPAGVYTVIIALAGIVQTVLTDQSIGGASGTQGGGTALVLQVNGAPASSQLLQNITGLGAVTISDQGAGTIGISVAPTVLPVFQTNGVPNILQSKLNLHSSNASVTLTADALGGVDLQAQSAAFSGSGTYMVGPGIRSVNGFLNNAASSIFANIVRGVQTNNRVVVWLLQLEVAMTISKVSVMASNNSIGVHSSFGIYSYAGAKLIDGGIFNEQTSPAVQTNTITPVPLTPGMYWFAQTSDDHSCSFYGQVASSQLAAAYTANSTRVAYATNTSSVGALPATLGALTAFVPDGSSDGYCLAFFE